MPSNAPFPPGPSDDDALQQAQLNAIRNRLAHPIVDRFQPAPNTPTAPPPVDVTDQALQQARLSARLRSLMGMGLDSTFLTNPFTDGGAVSLSGTGY